MGTEIASWKEKLAAIRETAAQAERTSGGWFSFQGGRLSYGDVQLPGDQTDVVVLAALRENVYYDQPYSADQATEPACSAIGTVEALIAPRGTSPSPQSKDCASCPRNQWGTGHNGRGKACKNKRRLVMIAESDAADPAAIATAPVAYAQLPVTSVKNWSSYVESKLAPAQCAPLEVVTQMKVVPNRKTQFEVVFQAKRTLEGDATLAALVALSERVVENLLRDEQTDEDGPAGAEF